MKVMKNTEFTQLSSQSEQKANIEGIKRQMLRKKNFNEYLDLITSSAILVYFASLI